jgi:hypothetical protein
VILVANGGTVAPSALGGPDANLASPGTLSVESMAFAPGGSLRVHMNSAFEGPYTSSLLSGVGTLDLSGLSAGNTFTIRPDTLALSNTDGPLYDFDSSQPSAWTIASFTGGITGFAADKFTVDTTDFANAMDGGFFTIAQEGNTLVLNFAPVPEPGFLLLATVVGGVAARGLRNFDTGGRVAARVSCRPPTGVRVPYCHLFVIPRDNWSMGPVPPPRAVE